MTLHYDFPSIHWWHTVAKHFEGNENFVVVDKGDEVTAGDLEGGVGGAGDVAVLGAEDGADARVGAGGFL